MSSKSSIVFPSNGVAKCLCAIVLVFCMLLSMIPAAYADGNIIFEYKTSFEDAAETGWTMVNAAYATDFFHDGAQSLKLTYPSATAAGAAASKRFFVTPGNSYNASVWLRAENLVGQWAGGRLGIDAYDSAGKWIYGTWTNPVGVGSWNQMKSQTYIAPANAAYVTVSLYTNGTSGTIWFDELVFTESSSEPFSTRLITPSYRGLLIPGGNQNVHVETKATDGFSVDPYTTKVELFNEMNQLVDFKVYPGALSTDTVFDMSGYPAGTYEVTSTAILTASDKIEKTEKWSITKVASPADLPKSYIDDHGRFWKDGELFFPIGIYTGDTVEEELIDLKTSAINTILPYSRPNLDELNLANQYGLNVIYSFKDFYYGSTYAPKEITSIADETVLIRQLAEQYKAHPALLAWYLNDESPFDKRLPDHYKTILAADPDHPAYTVDMRNLDSALLRKTTDIFGLDYYPIYGNEGDSGRIGTVGSLQKIQTNRMGNQGQWAVVQAHNYGNYVGYATRPPTTDEIRNIAWQNITEGAKGIIFYSLFDLQRDKTLPYEEGFAKVKTVAQELKDMAPIILSVEEPLAVQVPTIGGLHTMVKGYGGKSYIVAVNSNSTEQAVTFTVPGADGLSVRETKENRNIDLTGGQFSDTLAPLAVRFYEIGAKAETYTVSFDANGGSGTMAEGTVTAGQAFTLPANGFTAPEGKRFHGWAIGNPDGESVSAETPYTFTANTTVYAIWEDIPEEESGIIIIGVRYWNHQANIDFDIVSANGKGYKVYISKTKEPNSFVEYKHVNYNAKGMHLKELEEGDQYVFIEYTKGDIVMRSGIIKITLEK